jgi:two-component system, NtrC family, sensor kinase
LSGGEERKDAKVEAGSPSGPPAPSEEARPLLSGGGYRRLRRTVTLATAAVSLLPLLIMTLVNYFQYQEALEGTTKQSISRLLSNNKQSLEFFLAERVSALSFIIHDRSLDELCTPGALTKVIRNMNRAFALGSFLDLGIINSGGKQRCYRGPHRLEGHDYSDQRWFHRAAHRGTYTSDVFLGHRHSPHFAIATRHQREDDFYLLRATFDAEVLSKQIHTAGLGVRDDIFLVNRKGLLQTPSRRFGEVQTKVPLDLPHNAPGVEVIQHEDQSGRPILLGYASIANSPFTLMFVKPLAEQTGWPILARLAGFLAVSAVLILVVILWGTRLFVRSLRAENLRRAALMHEVEYSNKLASIGRLAAGMAHEINNPLAIINEKTGLLKDTIALRDESEHHDKYLALIDSVLGSVDRCKKITHRLLGFARRMDVEREEIDMPLLLEEVVSFLEKEAAYRGVEISVEAEVGAPTIESDRGQLQQVFLNLVNNAIGAVDDGGKIAISQRVGAGWLAVSVSDDGAGIPKENLQRIFEPFFTTKEGSGTGLGLSITYGIIKKLGGEITVESEVGQGTTFTVQLPLRRE